MSDSVARLNIATLAAFLASVAVVLYARRLVRGTPRERGIANTYVATCYLLFGSLVIWWATLWLSQFVVRYPGGLQFDGPTLFAVLMLLVLLSLQAGAFFVGLWRYRKDLPGAQGLFQGVLGVTPLMLIYALFAAFTFWPVFAVSLMGLFLDR
jgi:hypothetical protein